MALAGACAFGVIACAKLAGFEDVKPNGDESSTQPPQDRGAEAGGGVIESPSHLEGDVEISPNALEFGPVACGTEATPQKITIRNTTNAAVSYQAVLPAGSGFAMKGAPSGEVPAMGSVTLDVTASPTFASDANGGVIISAGKSYLEVLTHAKGLGAVLEFVPTQVDFGEIRKGTIATPLPVELKNTGTGPAVISGVEGKTANLDAMWDPSGALTILPTDSKTISATFNAPATPGLVETTLKPTVTSPMCAAAPELKTKGTSVDTTVTLSGADFGVQPCNSTPPNRDVTISNFSNTTLTVSGVALSVPSLRFSVASATTFQIQPATSPTQPGLGKITIAANPTGLDLTAANENLSLSIAGVAAPDGGPRTTSVKIDVRGAILTINPSLLEFSSNGSSTDNKVFPIQNTGNSAITVYYDFTRTIGPAAWFPDKNYHQIGANQTSGISMGFRPDSTLASGTEHQATMTPIRYSGAKACTAMPVATAHGIKQ